MDTKQKCDWCCDTAWVTQIHADLVCMDCAKQQQESEYDQMLSAESEKELP